MADKLGNEHKLFRMTLLFVPKGAPFRHGSAS